MKMLWLSSHVSIAYNAWLIRRAKHNRRQQLSFSFRQMRFEMNYEVNEGQTTWNEFVWIIFIDNFHKFNRLLDPQYVYFRCGKFLVFQYLFPIQFLNNLQGFISSQRRHSR